MKKENVRRKKKIAKYFLILILVEITFSLTYAFMIYKSVCEMNVTDTTIMLNFYIGVLASFGILIVVLISAVVLYLKVISFNEK